MPLYQDEGVVLRTVKLGEADRIVTLLTPWQNPRRRQRCASNQIAFRRSFGAFHARLVAYCGRAFA